MKNIICGSIGLGFFTYLNSYSSLKKSNCLLDKFERHAMCILNPDNSTAKGVVRFKQESVESPTFIKGKFTGLKKNAKHGFHIHEFGDLSEGCKSAGAHYNPTNRMHGGPEDEEKHVGDLGNIQSDENGNAIYERQDGLISLVGKYSVVGRSCVVHESEDDLGRGSFPDSKTTGHSGARIACGIIVYCTENKNF